MRGICWTESREMVATRRHIGGLEAEVYSGESASSPSLYASVAGRLLKTRLTNCFRCGDWLGTGEGGRGGRAFEELFFSVDKRTDIVSG